MIIGGEKSPVIQNIRQAIADNDLNRKVELGDPALSAAQRRDVSMRCIQRMGTPTYHLRNFCARTMEDMVGWTQNLDTQIVGLEHLKGVPGGAIVTSNHFSPLDSTIIRKLAKKTGRRRLYTVSQDTNFAVPGIIGFFLYYADTIPITSDSHYTKEAFLPLLRSLLDQKQWVLIYPEQEMWFHYRKPRPPKRGAYYYAAQCGAPVISCFVEMRERDKRDNAEFRKVRHTLHILPPIYPEAGKSPRENSIRMMQTDYLQKKQAYEEIYGQPLSYAFQEQDIAGWMP